jgi:hypothetical protein
MELELLIAGTVFARAVRCGSRPLSMVFRLESETVDRVERTIETLGDQPVIA